MSVRETSLDKPSVVDVFRVRAPSKKRLVNRLGVITESEQAREALKVIFGL